MPVNYPKDMSTKPWQQRFSDTCPEQTVRPNPVIDSEDEWVSRNRVAWSKC